MPDQKPPEPDKDLPITDEEEPLPDVEEGAKTPGPGGVAEMVRRALMAGVGAVFLTEEGIRKTVSELKLPKEALGYLAQQADKTRTEANRIVRKELRRFLNSDAFKQQIAQALSGLTLEIKAEVRLRPDAAGPKPDIQAKMRVKNSPKDEPTQ
jgi:hypothetical protein